METWTSNKRRIKPGKTLSPRPTNLKAWAYKEFKLGELFEFKGVKQAKSQGVIPSQHGGIPYVVQSLSNNMVSRNVDRKWLVDNNEPPVPGNAIVLGVTLPAVSYQPYEFGASQVITARADFLNEKNALYFVALLNKQMARFSYSNKPGINIYKELSLVLPITSLGHIDFAFMEACVQEMEHIRIQEMEAFLKSTGFENCELTSEEKCAISSLANKEFMNFSIDSLFEINTGRDIIIGRVENGDVPLISHQHDNNGISKRIKQLSHRKLFDHKKTIALADRGVFYATTQAEDFHIGTRVKALTFKNGTQKENVRLFFVASINKLQVLFTDYLVNATDKLPSLKIKLPVTSSGEIDYHFMEVYIRAQEKLAIQRVKDWRAKEITTTKSIVDDESSKIIPLVPKHNPIPYRVGEDYAPSMVAEDIFIPGSLEVRLRNTKREELLSGNLDLILMYAIGHSARKKTEQSGKIALGIKEENLSTEAIKAFESVKHIMFHYWKNSEAVPFKLTSATRLVEESDIPEGYLVRQQKGAKQYLLIEYDADNPSEIGAYDILKAQRQKEARYIPFVCKVENIK